MKRKRKALMEREERITDAINSGNMDSDLDTRLPLSVISSDSSQRISQKNIQKFSQEEVARLQRLAKLKLKLKATAMCLGITCVRDEANDEVDVDDLTVFVLLLRTNYPINDWQALGLHSTI